MPLVPGKGLLASVQGRQVLTLKKGMIFKSLLDALRAIFKKVPRGLLKPIPADEFMRAAGQKMIL